MEDKQQQRAREHPPQTTLTGSALEGFIREALLSRDHGIWYQFVEDETQPDGTVATKAVSNPIRSQEFLRLYDIHAESDQNIVQKGLSRSDQHLALTARNSAMNPRGEPVACTVTMRDSQSLRPKRVIEMYARRITLPDERVVLASLHSDLASSNEWHGIHSMALEQLNVFIFVKEWHSESQRFLFRYVNAPLAKALGVKSPIHVVGKSDYDYFEKAVADRFQQDDQEVASSKPGFRLVVEEDLPSCRNALRLTTIKTQYERFAPRSGITGGTMVLGMSFDITPVTGVLREVINQSQDAVYIKDAAMRYTAVNARFLELLNLNRGVDIRHHTFSEALNHLSVEERSKYYTPTELSALKAKIEKEDKALLDQPNGTHKSVVRRAINGTECLTRKSLVSFEGQKHIIGVTRSLFSGVSTQFFEKASQSICVKDHNLRIVWCNRSYAKRHRKSEQQIIGLQDTDLWPDEIFGDQAKRYQDKDRRVLAIGKRIHASQKHHGGRSAEATWKSLISQLRRNKCYEFRETQRINKRTERILQTTKWPEFIEGKWYVVVVYSDVTEGDSKIVEYHRSTVHTLRSILYPIDAACDMLDHSLEEKELRRAPLRQIASVLHGACKRQQWFFNCHLKLLRMAIDPKAFTSLSFSDLVSLIAPSVEVIQKIGMNTSVAQLNIENSRHSRDRMVGGDRDFLQVVFGELLRNAWVAIMDAHGASAARNIELSLANAAKAASSGRQRKNITLPRFLGRVRVTIAAKPRGVRISIADNGIACSAPAKRVELSKAWSLAKYQRNNKSGQYGLSFCKKVIKSHGGSIELSAKSVKLRTVFEIVLPWMKLYATK